jgi:glycosyltransferase involved in cell wall biosynthesis
VRDLARQVLSRRRKLLYFVTEDWYFCSHRLPLAIAAKAAGYDVTVLTRVQAHGEVIKAAGLNLVPFEISRRGMNPLTEVVTIARLVAAYRRLAPDLVHHVAVKPVIYGSIAARLTRVPGVVNALVGLGWIFTSTNLLARLIRRVVETAMPFLLNRGVVIVQNPDNAAVLLALGVDKARIRLIRGSGVDTATFRPGPEPQGAPVVLLPARMLWAKGVGEFVNVAERVRASGIDARFVLVGQPDPGNPSTVSQEQLQEWQREHRVEWWGYHADMAEVFRQAQIVCLPSYYGEGVPMSLLEAASTGLPIVTTDVAGCRDVVKDGDNGFLIPVRDGAALADALVRLLRDSELRKRMGARGRKRAVSEFDVGSVVSATLAIYQEIHAKAFGVGTHELYRQRPL